MQRKIKFRGKFLDDTSEWLYGNYVFIEDDVFHYKIADKSGLLLDIDINTLGQYTGLKDKNGKEIYEGDILKCKQYLGGNFIEHCIEKGFIEFRNGEFGLYRKQGYYQSLNKFIEYAYEFEVIGNIYDNPELLEEGE